MACKVLSKGSKLWYSADGVEPYTQLTGVKSISGPNITRESKEQTSLDSTGGWKEFCTGFKDGGEMSAQLYFNKTARSAMDTMLGTDAPYYWRITAPLQTGEATPSKVDFQGHLTALGADYPENDSIMMPTTVKVTGAVTFTPGA